MTPTGTAMPHRLFFLHIPKTAGTTLNSVLDQSIGQDSIFDVYTEEQKRRLSDLTYDEMERYRMVRGHLFIANFDHVFDGPMPFTAFTFLREPVSRVVSEYHFLRSWPKSHLYRFLNENDVSLTDYVTSDRPELRHRGCNAMVNSLSGAGADSIEEGLAQAWHNLSDRFAFFGLLERFDESLLALKRTIGLGNVFYERRNVQAKQVVPATPREADVIRERNQADLALYSLACAEFDRRMAAMDDLFRAELRRFTRVNDGFGRVARLIEVRDGVDHGQFRNGK